MALAMAMSCMGSTERPDQASIYKGFSGISALVEEELARYRHEEESCGFRLSHWLF